MSLAPADVAILGIDTGALSAVVTERYERRGRELWGLARRLGASDEEAHDAVQEAHLRLWHELGRGTEIEDLDAWTFRVLYRLVMDQHRLARRVGAIVGRLRERRSEVEHVEVDDRLSLWPFVDRLPARERTTLYLRYRVDLSFEQIGSVMGIRPGAARAYASRGLERLRHHGPDGPDGPIPALAAWLDPLLQAPPLGMQVRVHGHFDDPRANQCSPSADDIARFGDLAGAGAVFECRVRFVITGFERVAAP